MEIKTKCSIGDKIRYYNLTMPLYDGTIWRIDVEVYELDDEPKPGISVRYWLEDGRCAMQYNIIEMLCTPTPTTLTTKYDIGEHVRYKTFRGSSPISEGVIMGINICMPTDSGTTSILYLIKDYGCIDESRVIEKINPINQQQ